MVLVNGKKGLVDVRHSHNRIRLPEKKILLTMYLCNRLNTYLGQTLVHLESLNHVNFASIACSRDDVSFSHFLWHITKRRAP